MLCVNKSTSLPTQCNFFNSYKTIDNCYGSDAKNNNL